MSLLLVVVGLLAVWAFVALVLALAIGRAVRIADVKHADDAFLRDLARLAQPAHA